MSLFVTVRMSEREIRAVLNRLMPEIEMRRSRVRRLALMRARHGSRDPVRPESRRRNLQLVESTDLLDRAVSALAEALHAEEIPQRKESIA